MSGFTQAIAAYVAGEIRCSPIAPGYVAARALQGRYSEGGSWTNGFWSLVNAWAGQFGLTEPAGIVRASGVPGAG